MATDKEVIRLSLAVSPELNERLEQLAAAAAASRDYHALKGLQTFFVVAFLDAHMNAHGIARNECGNIAAQLRFVYLIQ